MSNLVSTSNHLKEYTEYLNYEKNFSKYTVKNYNIDINKFLNYLKTKEITKLNEINNETIQMYIISLNNDGLNPNSVSRIKSSVCSFIKFLYKKKYIPKDPIIRITVPKKQKKQPQKKTKQIRKNQQIEELPNEKNILAEGGEFYFCPKDKLLFSGINRNTIAGAEYVASFLNANELILIDTPSFHLDTVFTTVFDKKGALSAMIVCEELVTKNSFKNPDMLDGDWSYSPNSFGNPAFG